MGDEMRIAKLRGWMAERFISWTALGRQLGMTPSGAQCLLLRESCSAKRHSELLSLGFPQEILPIRAGSGRAKVRKPPVFPGLQPTQGAAS